MNRIDPLTHRRPTALALSGVLWLATVVLSVLLIFALRDMLIWGLGLVIPQPTTKARLETANVISLAQQCGVIVFGLVGLILLIYCTDRLIREAGQPKLLRTLARIIAVEFVLVLPAWWILWR
ncbi:MAG: hypothetical protein IT319_16080 [Anaerolineae bacterium]|nr:hypothetical protein [Anaerolineae bacterium]